MYWINPLVLVDMLINILVLHGSPYYSPRFAWGGRPHRRCISVRPTDIDTCTYIWAKTRRHVAATQCEISWVMGLMHLRVSPVLRLKPGGRQFCIIKQPCFKQGQPSGVAARPPWADLVVHHGKLSNSLSMREQIGCFILFRNMTHSFEVK